MDRVKCESHGGATRTFVDATELQGASHPAQWRLSPLPALRGCLEVSLIGGLLECTDDIVRALLASTRALLASSCTQGLLLECGDMAACEG